MGAGCLRKGRSHPAVLEPESRQPPQGAARAADVGARAAPEKGPVAAEIAINAPAEEWEDEEEKEDEKEEEEQFDDRADISPLFLEILTELEGHERQLGGVKNFQRQPRIRRKVKRRDFATRYTDYEYVYLTVLGFAKLHAHGEEISRKDNGEVFNRNPGVQMLERVCGLTMHADRKGAGHLLREAPASLLQGFQLAGAEQGGFLEFFRGAFDRTADPCLEGRARRLLEYIAKARAALDPSTIAAPPWEDVQVQILPEGVAPRDLVAEHLRVFMGECTWRWSRERELAYERAKELRLDDEHAADFTRLYNAGAFESTMVARGIVLDDCSGLWESSTKGGEWVPYEADVSDQIERAHAQGRKTIETRLGPKSWRYIVDLDLMVQRNPVTGQERSLRRVVAPVTAASRRPGKLTHEELREGIRYFVELHTLPPAPAAAGNDGVAPLRDAEALPPVEPETQPPATPAQPAASSDDGSSVAAAAAAAESKELHGCLPEGCWLPAPPHCRGG